MIDVTQAPSLPAARDDRKIVGLIGLAHFNSHVYFLILPPLFAYIRADYGLSYTQLGAAISVFNIVSAVLQTPTGFLVDRVGARNILIAGLLVGAGGVAFAAALPSYWALVTGFAIAGLANTVYHPAHYTILSHRIPARRIGRAFSIHSFFGMLGSAVAPASMLLDRKSVV